MVVQGGLALAIPSDTVLDFLKRGSRPALGVVVQPVVDTIKGLLILEVASKSAAENASLLIGDVLIGANGHHSLESADDLGDEIDHSAGAVLSFASCKQQTGGAANGSVRAAFRITAGGGLIRVQIETDSAVTRAGLEALLREQPGLEVVSAASEADVLIRDDVTELAEDLPVVVLSDELSPQDGLRSGARAVLSRNAPPAQIIAAIQAASAGLVVIPADVGTFVQPRVAEQIAEPLTPRETDVLEMLAEGVSNKVIAYRLGISEHTAKFHVNSILAKLDAGTRTEAVMRGIRLGLIKI